MGMKGSKVKRRNWIIFGLILALVAVLAVVGTQKYSVSDEGDVKDDGTGVTPPLPVQCDSQTTPDLTISAYDTENVGTSLSESANLYRRDGDKTWSVFTAGTAITNVEVGAVYEVVMGINTSDMTDNAYGPLFKTDPIACKEVVRIEKAVANDEIETSLSSTFYNADGDAAAETFSAGQTQTVSLKILTGSDEFFGNPFIKDSELAKGNEGQRAEYPNVVCMDLNATAWDTPLKVIFKGVEMKRVSQPTRHSAVTDKITYCYEAPIFTDSLMESDRYSVRLDADDTTAPTADDTAYIYAANFFVNTDSGDVEFGVENNDGTAVGTDAADSVTLDFTA